MIVFVGVYQRTQVKYGDRAPRYVHIEIGGAAENVYLQATALGLGTVFIGAFSDDQVMATLGLPGDERPPERPRCRLLRVGVLSAEK